MAAPLRRAAYAYAYHLPPSLRDLHATASRDNRRSLTLYGITHLSNAFIESTVLPLYCARFRPAANRRKDFGGPFVPESTHGADIGCPELFRQLFQDRPPINARRATGSATGSRLGSVGPSRAHQGRQFRFFFLEASKDCLLRTDLAPQVD